MLEETVVKKIASLWHCHEWSVNAGVHIGPEYACCKKCHGFKHVEYSLRIVGDTQYLVCCIVATICLKVLDG